MLVNIFFGALFFCVSADLINRVINDKDCEHTTIVTKTLNPQERNQQYWRKRAQDTLNSKLNQKLNINTAKNIVFFLGDGLSIPSITAARIYQGQLLNKTGEEEQLFFETFPYTGLSKTYCTNAQVADSACTSTAYMTGVKTNYRSIGVSANVNILDCEAAKQESNQPTSIIQWAQEAGKATGIVTNTRITHASPAGGYAHVPFRDMECDTDVIKKMMDPIACNYDIAKQLVYDEPGKNIKVLMGGGRSKLLPKTGIKSLHGNGSRSDEDLVEVWLKDKASRKVNAAYVTNLTELQNLDIKKTDYVLGLFAPEHLGYHLDNREQEPTLEKMTEVSIKLLLKEKNGFYLFVEGGEIDMAHHTNQAHKALDETIEFVKAIEMASKLTKEEDTLIIVTADHAHTMSMSGYPARGTDILGFYGKAKDGLPYSTLSYANGPGYKNESSTGVRYNITNDNTDDPNYVFPALNPRTSETHGGDDVAVYARGPWAHLFTGNYEQNYIPVAEAYAANIGPLDVKENAKQVTNEEGRFSNGINLNLNYLFVVCSIICTILLNT